MNRDQERLEDILEYTRLIRRHTASGRSALDDEVTQAAVTRWLEIIGEAAGAVSAELRVDYPEVPWRDLVGMRNILVHAYRRVNLNLVWRAVERLPEIEAQIGYGDAPAAMQSPWLGITSPRDPRRLRRCCPPRSFASRMSSTMVRPGWVRRGTRA